MSNNPFINAGAAAAYIGGLVLFIFYVLEPMGEPETLLLPMAMLTLLVLSVLVMGYTLILSPLRLYLDGEKERGVALFVQTLAAFATLALILFGLLLCTAYQFR